MKLSLKDSLFLGFCAVFIVSAKMALRLHLKIPGHSMFFTMFFLLIARGCVKHRLAASFSGLLAGILTMLLGLGKGGPLLIVKFILPGLIIDLLAGVIPGLFQSVVLCMLAAGLAAASRLLTSLLIDFMVGMDTTIMLQHALIKSAGSIFFGMASGAAVPAVIRKLISHGVIDEQGRP